MTTRSGPGECISGAYGKHLRLFQQNFASNICITILDDTACSNKRGRANHSNARLARFDSWIAIVAILFTNFIREGGHRQKLYACTYKLYGPAAMRQAVGLVGSFFKVFQPDRRYLVPAQ